MNEVATTEMPKNLTAPKSVKAPSSLRFSEMTLKERMEICTFLAGSTSIPKSLQGNPANVYYVAERGDRIGLSITESISCVYVVNGVTALWGDIPLALCRASDQWDPTYFDEWIEVAGQRVGKDFDNQVLHAAYDAGKSIIAYCQAKRKDMTAQIVRSYSIQDAVLQELHKKDTWHKSPRRMLQRRARALALTDGFSDVLFGLYSAEQAEDAVQIGPDTDLAMQSQPATIGQTIAQQPEPATVQAPVTPPAQTPASQPAQPEQDEQPAQPNDEEWRQDMLKAETKLCDTTEGTAAYKGVWLSFKLPADRFQADSGFEHVPVEQRGFYLKMLQAALRGLGKGRKVKTLTGESGS